MALITCKECGKEFSDKAPSCPNCGYPNVLYNFNKDKESSYYTNAFYSMKKENKKFWNVIIWIFVIIAVLIVISKFSSGENNTDSTSTATSGSTINTANESTETPIEYAKYDVSELLDDLDSNAMKAEKKYTDQYVEITGKMYSIDSDGKYIDLCPTDEEFTFTGVQCYIKTDEQADKIIKMEKDQTITLKGKITEVGEVMGYSLDIDEIE